MFIRLPVILVTLAISVLAALPGSASAQPSTTGSVWAGGSAYVSMALAAPADECQLLAQTGAKAPVAISSVRPTAMHIAWVWQVPGRARSATWRLSAICGNSQIGVVMMVHGPRHRSVLALVHQIRVLQFGGTFPTPQALQLTLVPVVARTWWTLTSHTILSAFHTGRSAGQCTDYVAGIRPDVIMRVDVWAYVRHLLLSRGALNVNWLAKDWAVEAEQAGLPTGNVPQPGAVMVFQPGAYGAYSDGHVAIVDEVNGDGSFTISAMHAPVVGQVSSRTFSARTARAMVPDPRVRFIYR
jgi:hypothetical protein